MWLIGSLVIFFGFLLLFGGGGWAVASILHASFGRKITAAMQPGTWAKAGVVANIILAVAVTPVAKSWWGSVFGSEFFAWWAVACLIGGFAFAMATYAAFERAKTPDDVNEPRFGTEATEHAEGTLHIYGQEAWHSDAYIVGSVDALEEVRRALANAISNPSGVGTTRMLSPSDSEGYHVLCIRVENAAFFGKLRLPYFGDSAGGPTPEGKVRMLFPAELQEAIASAVREADESSE